MEASLVIRTKAESPSRCLRKVPGSHRIPPLTPYTRHTFHSTSFQLAGHLHRAKKHRGPGHRHRHGSHMIIRLWSLPPPLFSRTSCLFCASPPKTPNFTSHPPPSTIEHNIIDRHPSHILPTLGVTLFFPYTPAKTFALAAPAMS